MWWLIPVGIAGVVVGKVEYDKYKGKQAPLPPAAPPWVAPSSPVAPVVVAPPIQPTPANPNPVQPPIPIVNPPLPPPAPPAVDYTKVPPKWIDTAIGKQGATVDSTTELPAITAIYNNPNGGASAINPTVKDSLNQWAITVSFHDTEMPLPLDGNYDAKTQKVMALFQAYSNDPLAQEYYKSNGTPNCLGVDPMDGLWMGPTGTDFDRHAGSQLVGWGSGIEGGSYADGGGGSSPAAKIMMSHLIKK